MTGNSVKTTATAENMLALFDNKEKISKEDNEFCANQNKLLNTALDQLTYWYELLKGELPAFEETHDVKFKNNGKTEVTDLFSNPYYSPSSVPPANYYVFFFTPFESFDKIIDTAQQATRRFIRSIIEYFNRKYSMDIIAPELDEENFSINDRPEYMTYVDYVIAHLNRVKS